MTCTQLRLATEPSPWKLDSTTRSIGKAGLASARAALAAHENKPMLIASDHALAA